MTRTLVVILALLATPVAAETLTVEFGSGWSRGGAVLDYIAKRNSVDAVRIRGQCFSSCAVFLSHPNVCVYRSAVFGFHALSRYGRKADWETQVDFTNYLGSEALGEWFLANAAKRRWPARKLTGSEIIDTYGFRECDK